nr:hypothetical protein [Candidatus Mycoplasma haematolamae]
MVALGSVGALSVGGIGAVVYTSMNSSAPSLDGREVRPEQKLPDFSKSVEQGKETTYLFTDSISSTTITLKCSPSEGQWTHLSFTVGPHTGVGMITCDTNSVKQTFQDRKLPIKLGGGDDAECQLKSDSETQFVCTHPTKKVELSEHTLHSGTRQLSIKWISPK